MEGAKEQRNSSIELLRIIAMLGVVILHYNNAGIEALRYDANNSINEYFLLATYCMFVCAVNLFVMISAYFLSCSQQRRFIKVLELFIQVIAFHIFFYFGGLLRGNEFSWKSLILQFIPDNYFVVLYSALYLISPYINILVKKLDKATFKRLLVLLMLVFSVWNFFVDMLENICGRSVVGLSTIGAYGSQGGYTIVNFILIYFIGAYIQIHSVSISKRKICAGISVCFAILYIALIVEKQLGLSWKTALNYDNPMIIMMAVFLLLFFIGIDFKSKVINEIAKGAFTCFLFHGPLMQYLYVERYVNGSLIVLVLHQFGVALFFYIVSYVVYKIYCLCSHWFIKLITPICDRIDVSGPVQS